MISDFFTAFNQGKRLADSSTWKNRAAATSALALTIGAILAIAKGFGYDIPVDSDTVQAIAGGIAASVIAFNGIVQIITSKSVGLPAVSGTGPTDTGTGGKDAPAATASFATVDETLRG